MGLRAISCIRVGFPRGRGGVLDLRRSAREWKFHHVSITVEKAACPGTQSTLSVYSAIDDLRPSCRPIDIDMLTTSKEIGTYVGPYVGNAGYTDTAFVYDDVTVDFE